MNKIELIRAEVKPSNIKTVGFLSDNGKTYKKSNKAKEVSEELQREKTINKLSNAGWRVGKL